MWLCIAVYCRDWDVDKLFVSGIQLLKVIKIMSIIYVLIPIALLFVMIGLGIFFWAVRTKQFDDLDKEGFSILFDEKNTEQKSKPPKHEL